MRFLIVGFVCFLWIAAQGAPTKLDLNNDGKPEEISCVVTSGGNNQWLDVAVKVGKKVVFQEKGLCVGIESYQFTDLDPLFAGREIVVWRRSVIYESGDRSGKSYYSATIHRWSPAGKFYVPYLWYEMHREVPTGDVVGLNTLLMTDAPRYLAARDKIEQFVRAVAKADWATAKKLLDTDPDAAPITLEEAKKLRQDCQKFPSAAQWTIYSSPHEAVYMCFCIQIPKKTYTVVVNSGGINKMATGDFD